MALMVCEECTTKYSVGAPACPHCGDSKSHMDGEAPPPRPVAKKAPARSQEVSE